MHENLASITTIIAALVTGFLAVNQIRINNITNARLKWLEDLKKLVTDFYSDCSVLSVNSGILKGFDYSTDKKRDDKLREFQHDFIKEIVGLVKKIDNKYELIRLHLNPYEEAHILFEKQLVDYMKLINVLPTIKDLNEFVPIAAKMRSNTDFSMKVLRGIMKLEWEKTKHPIWYKIYYVRFGNGKKILDQMQVDLKEFNKGENDPRTSNNKETK